MSQTLSQIPHQLLSQQQRLTPQLIQAMDILQLPLVALDERIEQELDSNPALERAADEFEPATVAESADGVDGEQALVLNKDDSADDFERLDTLVTEYDWIEDEEFRPSRSAAQLAEDGDAKLEAMARAPARPISLRDYLLEQWALLDLDATTREIGATLIDEIDEHGRLAASVEAMAERLDQPIARVKDALARVQSLDPPGVGARDLAECLLLQLELAPYDCELECRIIEERFDDLQRNRLPQIAKALGVGLEDIKAAVDHIARLSMHPGHDFSERVAPGIVPDIIVDYDEEEGRYVARLARGNQRELRISPEFRQLLERSRNDKSVRDFARQKVEQASAIIDALRFRRERLIQVAQAAIDAQRDFFDRGEQHLTVLRMSDLAERFDCDPSTISRTVDEKWMQTPRGVIPLRRLFTGGTESDDGEALGWESVKARVREIIENEDRRKPLSDDQIVKQLSADGIEIKRRTVAKYRSQLSIPTARQRKQH
ncbi:MAG: RNA polymerase factor sigma-54 [Phycisphaerales bacterium]|nr:RNA polymerase factor sigma-54 [Phycisphaerales bacterium]